MLYLNVPFSEKDQAKALYAKWDQAHKKWYADNPKYYYKFAKWITGNTVLSDRFYIVESVQKCWKCHEISKVVTFGYGPHLIIEGSSAGDYHAGFMDNGIYITGDFAAFPKIALAYVQNKFPVRERYSKTRNCSYISNGCEHCNALFGNWNLYNEPDSPFFIDNPKKLNNLTVYKIPLKYDIAITSTEIPLTASFVERDVQPQITDLLKDSDYFE